MISLLSGNQKECIPSKETAHEDLGCYRKTESQEKWAKAGGVSSTDLPIFHLQIKNMDQSPSCV